MSRYIIILVAAAGIIFGFTCVNTQNTAEDATKKPAFTDKKSKIQYKITGNLKGYKNHMIRMNMLNRTKTESGLVFIDSTFTDTAGNFSFSGNLDEISIIYIQYSSRNAVPLVIEAKSETVVNITPGRGGVDYELSGTNISISQEMYTFLKKYSQHVNELTDIERALSLEKDPMKAYGYQALYSQKQVLAQQHLDSTIYFQHPYIAYFTLFNLMEEPKPEHVKTVASRMEDKYMGSLYHTDLVQLYDKIKFLAVGEMAPDIVLPQPNDTILKLSDLRGKYVLIDFWASWCGPCRAEFPHVKQLYTKYKSEGFEIYGVSLDKDKKSWTYSIQSLNLPWKHVSDLQFWNAAPAKTYKVHSIPFTVLIDREGRIVAKNLRGADLEHKLEEIFSKN